MKNKFLIKSLNRKIRVRKKLKLVAKDKLRISFFRSNKNIEVQLIDDSISKTIICVSSLQSWFKSDSINKSNKDCAAILGKKMAELCLSSNVDKVYFDRGSYSYNGTVKSFCEAARSGGLNF